MTKKELKNKCTERAKIFQQAMESCKSSSPIDCIEWFADRISELEKENERLTVSYETLKLHDEEEIGMLKSENAELKADNDARKFAMAMSEKVEKQLREENAELKLKLEALEGQTPWKDIKDKSELIKENAELKARVNEQSERISELTQELDDKINRFG